MTHITSATALQTGRPQESGPELHRRLKAGERLTPTELERLISIYPHDVWLGRPYLHDKDPTGSQVYYPRSVTLDHETYDFVVSYGILTGPAALISGDSPSNPPPPVCTTTLERWTTRFVRARIGKIWETAQ